MASSEVEQIKERLNITEVVGQYVQLQKAGRNFRAKCPFHKERTPSFMVSPERGTYMCFGCGEKGDIFSFVEKMEGIDFRTALVQLADKAGVKLPKFSSVAPEVKAKEEQFKERLLECSEEATQFFEAELTNRKDVLEYIAKRTVTPGTIKMWRVGYAPASWDALSKHLIDKGFTKEEIVGTGLGILSEKKKDEAYDRFRGRIMFPIFDNGNRVIAFSGRFFEKVPRSREEGEPAKYVNSPETPLFHKSRVLYGLHAAKETIRRADCALLVEGQFDLLLAHQSGLRFAVAVSGTALTLEHLSLLSRYSKRLVMGLDNDSAGLRSGLKSTQMALAGGFDVKIPKLPDDCKDPADTAAKDPELLRNAVRESKTAIEFFLDALRKDTKDERAYKKIVEAQLLPLIAALPSRIDQAHFVTIVANRLRIPEDSVRAEVAKKLQRTARSDAELTQNNAEIKQEGEKFSKLEKAVAMMITRPDLPDLVRSYLIEIVGRDRLGEIEAKTKDSAEEFRFQFDGILSTNSAGLPADKADSSQASLDKVEGEEEGVLQMLVDTILQEKLDEDIATARTALHEAQINGDAGKQSDAVRQIQDLTKQKHILKND